MAFRKSKSSRRIPVEVSPRKEFSQSVKDTIKIYTDWANHYLEKLSQKRVITDLQNDVCDGVLLADVICAVTNENIPNIKSKPRNSAQMVENINVCLKFLSNIGVNVDGLAAKDIKEGNLKAILGLFFSLSRFKQQQKQQQQNQSQSQQTHHSQQKSSQQTHQHPHSNKEMLSRLPSPFSKSSGKCPTVPNPNGVRDGAVMANGDVPHNGAARRQGSSSSSSSKGQQNNNNQSYSSGSSLTKQNNIRDGGGGIPQPSCSSGSISSIPIPGGRLGGRSKTPDKNFNSKLVNSIANASSYSGSNSHLNGGVSNGSRLQSPSVSSLPSTTQTAQDSDTSKQQTSSSTKTSMLDKIFSKSKDKSEKGSKTVGKSGKSSNIEPAQTAIHSGATQNSQVTKSRSESEREGSKSLARKTVGRSSLGRGSSSSRLAVSRDKLSVSREDNSQKRITPPSVSARVPSSSSSSSVSNSKRGASPTPSRQSLGSASVNSIKSDKSSKIGSLVPKSGGSTGKLSKASSGSNSHIPAPSTGIPKPGSLGKGAKFSRDDAIRKSRTNLTPQGEHRQSSKSLSSSPRSSVTSGNFKVTSPDARSELGSTSAKNGEKRNSNSSDAGYDMSSGVGQYYNQTQSKSSIDRTMVQERESRIAPPHGSSSKMKSTKSNSKLYTSLPKPSSAGKSSSNLPIDSQSKLAGKVMVSSGGTQTNLSTLQRQQQQQQQISQQTHHYSNGTVSQEIQSKPNVYVPVEIQSPSNNTRLSSTSSPKLKHKEVDYLSELAPRNHKAHSPSQVDSPVSANNSGSSSPKVHSSSGHSNSSNDSVVFRPSSTDELSGSESNVTKSSKMVTSKPPVVTPGTKLPNIGLDKQLQNDQRKTQDISKVRTDDDVKLRKEKTKVETTFDAEIKTELKGVGKDAKSTKPSPNEKKSVAKETTFGEDGDDDENECKIKPMQPLNRSYVKDRPPTGIKPIHQIPTLSMQTSHYSSSSRISSSRLLDPSRFTSTSMKRIVSDCTQGNTNSLDYESDRDSSFGTYADVSAGYLSDGDILKMSRVEEQSGYLSEGGASMYARRMQQRFREGMQAVRECMQKSAGLIDDDSFDDDSSISSGEISDSLNDLEDENIGTLSDTSSFEPHAVPRVATNGNAPSQYKSLGNTSYGYGNGNASLDLNTDDLDIALSGGEHFWTREVGLRNNGLYGSLRKRQNIDPKNFDKVDDIIQKSQNSPWVKQEDIGSVSDSEAMKRSGSKGSMSTFGFRRPPSGFGGSNSSLNKNSKSLGNPNVGCRLSKTDLTLGGNSFKISRTSQSEISFDGDKQRPNGAIQLHAQYQASTLDHKRSNHGNPHMGIDPDAHFRSNTLGRRKQDGGTMKDRIFGSRGSLSGKTSSASQCSNTIISNPHATFSAGMPQHRTSTPKSLSADNRENMAVGHYMNNIVMTPEYMAHRVSASYAQDPMSAASLAWLKQRQSLDGSMGRPQSPRMSATESMESLSSASSIQVQLQKARTHSLSSAQMMQQLQREALLADDPTGSLNRANSIRSTKSEMGFPYRDMTRTSSFSQIGNGPVSPAHSTGSAPASRFTYPLTSVNPNALQHGASSAQRPNSMMSQSAHTSLPYGGFMILPKSMSQNDDVHGSTLSLASQSSSIYSTAEDKQAAEVRKREHGIRKLRRELESAQEKVHTLTSQLSTNAHVVAAFEQSLTNMTTRLQSLSNTAEQKDSELNELRATIEALKKQSGINLDLISPSLARRHNSTASKDSALGPEVRISRHMSSESMSSINSVSSACSATSQQSTATTDTDGGKKGKKKKSWLRSSFSKAFSGKKKGRSGSQSDVEGDTSSILSDASMPNSPYISHHAVGMNGHTNHNGSLIQSQSASGINDSMDDSCVVDLKKKLHEKDMKLTDIQLEALSSAHQLEQLRDTMNKMKNEMSTLKADNERLQRMVSPTKSPVSHVFHYPSLSERKTSMESIKKMSSESLDKRLSFGDHGPHSPLDTILMASSETDREGRRITVSVLVGCHGNSVNKLNEIKQQEIFIGSLPVCGKTKWDILDTVVRKIFKDFVARIDPTTYLGLNIEGIQSYHIGEITRTKDGELPELLPCGYLVGDTTTIQLSLKGPSQTSVDSLAFETLIPKSIIQRYISLLLEHRRIILCGPSGTGKTYLAQKLAEHLTLRSGKNITEGSIATFNVDHKSSKDLRQYLSTIAEQCESCNTSDLPSVIILDNLHHVGSLADVFNGFLSAKYQRCPYIIGTMNQATCSTTNLQLHHNFRWVLCANHMEPVKGFLSRYLRRKLIETEIRTCVRNNDLNKIVDWMPKVWQHLNKFLETHSSSDVTIGPRLFLSCPMDVSGSQVWFTDLWNYSIVPYVLEATRDGLQMYGKRSPWEDPAEWVLESYPWSDKTNKDWPSLLRLRPEDVGYDTQGVPTGTPIKTSQEPGSKSDVEGDPLLNMLMRLQEAASYSSPTSADSDSTSLDSHSSISSGIQELANTGIESTL